MAEIEDQLRAWADAAAPAGSGDAVGVDEVVAGPPPAAPAGPMRPWRAVAAAAAVLLVVAGIAVVVTRGDDAEPIRADQPATTTTAPAPDGPFADVDPTIRFEELRVGPAPAGRAAGLRAAQTEEQFEDLWADAASAEQPADAGPPDGLRPEVRFGRQVVVGITVPEGGCPLELVGFEQWASSAETNALVPRFRATGDVCTKPLVLREHLVAIDWDTLADRTWVFLSADQPAEGGAPDPADHQLLLDRDRTAPVLIDVVLDPTTVEAGGTLAGQVVVSNRSGAPIEATICGDPYVVGLRGAAYVQEPVRPACAEGFELPAETSTYDVEVHATVTSCTTNPSQVLGIAECLPDGSLPPMPAGEYSTFVLGPAADDADAAITRVTVTDP